MDILLEKNKPLLIHGLPGSGKTHVALELAKDMVLTKIDSSMLKSIKNSSYLLDIVKKRNVTLMFSEIKEQRCLLIDDIHVFQKYDRTFFKIIIEFIKQCKYYQTNIILVCNNSLIKNKDILKLKKFITNYEVNYNYSDYYKICIKIVKNLKITISGDKLDKEIYLSGYNFNTFITNINTNVNSNIDIKDKYDPIEKITLDLINNKFLLSELYRICVGDEIILSYNLLENLSKIVKYDIKKYNKIYETFIIADVIEYGLLMNDKDCDKYLSILSIANINYYIDNKCKDLIMNQYISKCMVLTNKFIINQLYFNIYLYDILIRYKDDKYNKSVMQIDKKEIEGIIKIYNFFY